MNRIIIILTLLTFTICAKAQKELNIGNVFDGKIISSKNKTETHIQGKPLEAYRLDVLRTLKVNATEKERETVEKLFTKDMQQAGDDKNDDFEMESRNGHLYYAVVQLSNYQGRHRFICYQCKKVDDEYRITLAYMRGKATMNELRKMFKK